MSAFINSTATVSTISYHYGPIHVTVFMDEVYIVKVSVDNLSKQWTEAGHSFYDEHHSMWANITRAMIYSDEESLQRELIEEFSRVLKYEQNCWKQGNSDSSLVKTNCEACYKALLFLWEQNAPKE